MLEAFSVPVAQARDASKSRRITLPQLLAESRQGWPPWVQETEEAARASDATAAIAAGQ